MDTKGKQTTAEPAIFKPAHVQRFLGITRSILTYWVDKLGLVTPYKKLSGISLYGFANLLNLSIVKVLTRAGFKASELKATMYLVQKCLGDDWGVVRKVLSDRARGGVSYMDYLGLEIEMLWKVREFKLDIVVMDRETCVLQSEYLKKSAPKERAILNSQATISIPILPVLWQATSFTKDFSWWPPEVLAQFKTPASKNEVEFSRNSARVPTTTKTP